MTLLERLALHLSITQELIRVMAFIYAMANQGNHGYILGVLGFWLTAVLVFNQHLQMLNGMGDDSVYWFKCFLLALFSPLDLICYATFAYIIWR